MYDCANFSSEYVNKQIFEKRGSLSQTLFFKLLKFFLRPFDFNEFLAEISPSLLLSLQMYKYVKNTHLACPLFEILLMSYNGCMRLSLEASRAPEKGMQPVKLSTFFNQSA